MTKGVLYLTALILISLRLNGAELFNYHRLVNQAELAIVDSNYTRAMTYFDSAFAERKSPFALDIYNASVCAIMAGKTRSLIAYTQLLIRKGAGQDFFKSNRIYSYVNPTQEWRAIMKSAPKATSKGRGQWAHLRRLVDSLADKDQLVNRDWRESGNAPGPRNRMDMTYDTISQHLLRIFDSVGFLSEDEIGIPLTETGRVASNPTFDIIIIHNFQARMRGDTLFLSTLRKALEQGKIKPERLAGIEDFGSNDGSRPYYGTAHFFVRYKCSIYLENIRNDQMEEIESNRKKIGLFSTGDYLKKAIYNLNHPGSDFRINAQVSEIGSFQDQASENYFLQNSKVIVDQVPFCK